MAKLVKNLINTFIKQPRNWRLSLVKEWHIIFGHLSAHVTLEKIYKDTIVLGVYDSCWMQELYLLSPTLIKAINATLDQPRIKQVRFKTVVRKKTSTKKLIKKNIPTKEIMLSTKEKQMLNKVEDKELRSALKAFLIRCYQEK